MYGFAPCSNGSRMLRPMVLPPASRAPRLAASMMPGPPPEVTTKRWFSERSVMLQLVSSRASSRASS